MDREVGRVSLARAALLHFYSDGCTFIAAPQRIKGQSPSAPITRKRARSSPPSDTLPAHEEPMKKPPDEPRDADRYLPPEVAEERFQEALRSALGAPYKKPQQSPATPPASEPKS